MERLDINQQKAVTSLRNTVVTAGAGSGKTTVLAARFLHLIFHRNAPVDALLALTFTNKAAAEMYTRIYRELLAADDPASPAALLDFHKAQIATLDSFCSRVARADAVRFGLPEDFSIGDEELDTLIDRAALDFYLANAYRPSLRALVKRYGLQGLRRDVLGRLARECFNLAGADDFLLLLAGQYDHLAVLLPRLLEGVETAGAALLEVEFQKYKTVTDNHDALKRAVEMRDLCAAGRWAEVRTWVDGLTLSKPGGKATVTGERLKGLIDDFKENAGRLTRLCAAYVEKDLRSDFYELLNDFQALVNNRKRSAGCAGFADVARMAVTALLENTPLRDHFKKQFRYIMIDEFQDNNHLQKELLYLLAERASLTERRVPSVAELEPDKLFFVGDEKQSIYGFRGAEVDVFKALKRELAGEGGAVHTLSGNYRSRSGLIAFFNRVFARVMSSPRFDFEAEFEPMEPAGAAAAENAEVMLFCKNTVDGDADNEEEALSADESEALALAIWIRETVTAGTLTVGRGENIRPAAYADCAVLLRSTGNQIIFERTFRRLGIPYETQSVRSLFMEPPVNDIYALLQCALHPDDRTAYAVLLRSPLVRLTDRGLLAALAAAPFAAAGLGTEDASRLARGAEYVRFIRERLDRWPVSRFIFHAWYGFGYRYHILSDPSAAMYLEYFDYFYALARRADERGQDLEEFLAWTRENLGRYEKLEDIELERPRPPGVKIMTVHKAKGLQFPIVIAANLGNRGRRRAKHPPVYVSGSFGPVVSFGEGSLLVELSAEEERDRDLAELKRLLYVALTRAEDHLVLSGVRTLRNKNDDFSLLTLLWRALDLDERAPAEEERDGYRFRIREIPDYGEDAWASGSRLRPADLAAVAERLHLSPAPRREWRKKVVSVTELNAIHKTTMSQEEYDRQTVTQPSLPADALLVTEQARAQWGTLTHHVINQKLLSRYEREAVPFGKRSGFDDREFETLAGAAETLADAFLASSWGRRVLRAGERETEFPFLFRYQSDGRNVLVRGDIDLYFIEEGRAYLIDFKTDRILNPREYEAQVALYRTALEAYTGLPVSAGLFALRSGEMMAIPDDFDLDGFMAACLAAAPLPVEQ